MKPCAGSGSCSGDDAPLAACALEFTVHVNSWVQHFVVYWLYNGLVLSAGAVCIARGLAHSRERAAWVLISSSFTPTTTPSHRVSRF